MTEALMLCSIGLLAGCLLMLLLVPVIHKRAVRITTRNMVDAIPLAATEIRAEKDQMRAQFAMALRQLEVNIEDLKIKSADQLGQIGRKTAEINRLRAELDKRAALILALQAREHVRGSITRRIVKIFLFIFIRTNRRREALARGTHAGVARAA